MDSCRQPTTASGAGQWYSENIADKDPGLIDGRQCYRMGSGMVRHAMADASTVVVGYRLRFENSATSSTNAAAAQLMTIRAAGGALGYLQQAGTQLIWRNDDGDVALATTPLGTLPFLSWVYVEVKVVLDATAGEVEIWMNGQLQASAYNVDTIGPAGSVCDDLWLGGFTSQSYGRGYMCDVYVLDDAGTAFNDVLGPVVIESLRPDGAGNYTNWTPSAGANYAAVDDPPEADHDGDATYVETDVAERDSYTVEDLASPLDPLAVQASVRARYTTAARTMNTFLRRSATDDDGPDDTTLQSGYETHAITIWEEDPVAAGAWTNANFDATEFGIRTT
jgi:hypothetical protein